MNKNELLNLLRSLYGKDNCYLVDILEINELEKCLKCSFLVPVGVAYANVSVPYVTAENYIRCISQASIAAVELLLSDSKGTSNVQTAFARLQWFYRGFEKLQFRKVASKGQIFLLDIIVDDMRPYGGNKVFVKFKISGENIVGTVTGCQLTEGHPELA